MRKTLICFAVVAILVVCLLDDTEGKSSEEKEPKENGNAVRNQAAPTRTTAAGRRSKWI